MGIHELACILPYSFVLRREKVEFQSKKSASQQFMQVKDQLVSSHGTVGFLTKMGLEREMSWK